jgi:subtilisin family serine protease
VRVAVVDTGVDVRHPDLAGRVLTKEDLVGNGFRGFTQDLHGTAVAGVIAAAANNSVGIVGVAPEARLLALKACWYQDASGTGAGSSTARCNSFTLARAIAAAIDGDAQVINMSLTGPADPLLERLLRAALERGIHVIAAADGDASFPASMRGIIGVQMAEDVAPDSSDAYVRAPGKEILTLRPAAHYDFETGSSIAAANVTGVVALLLQHRAKLTSDEIRVLLATSASKVSLRENAIDRSIDACAALAALLAADGCPQQLLRTARVGSQKKPLTPTK